MVFFSTLFKALNLLENVSDSSLIGRILNTNSVLNREILMTLRKSQKTPKIGKVFNKLRFDVSKSKTLFKKVYVIQNEPYSIQIDCKFHENVIKRAKSNNFSIVLDKTTRN